MRDHVFKPLAGCVQHGGGLAVAQTQSVAGLVQNVMILRRNLAVGENIADQFLEFLAAMLQGLAKVRRQKARGQRDKPHTDHPDQRSQNLAPWCDRHHVALTNGRHGDNRPP